VGRLLSALQLLFSALQAVHVRVPFSVPFSVPFPGGSHELMREPVLLEPVLFAASTVLPPHRQMFVTMGRGGA